MTTHTQQLLNPSPAACYEVRHESILLTQTAGAHAEGHMPATSFIPPQADGRWALLICGAGDNRFAFKHILIPAIVQHGISVLSIDPPGHGDHMHRPTTLATVQQAARAAADWIFEQPGRRGVGVLGISFGGCQAAWLAAHDPRIAALVTVAAPVTLEPVTEAKRWREGLQLFLPRNVGLLRHSSPRQILTEWFSIRGAVFGESLYDMIERFEMERTMAAVGERPTLIVHGDADVAVPVVNARRLHAAARDEKALLLVCQASHITTILHRSEMHQTAAWLNAKIPAR